MKLLMMNYWLGSYLNVYYNKKFVIFIGDVVIYV